MTSGRVVPIVDLDRPTEDVASDIGRACELVGFFQVVNHGVPDAVVEGGWQASQAFFSEPQRVRDFVRMPHVGYPYGYQPFEGEKLASSRGEATPPDRKHSFSIGPIAPPDHELTDPDEIWVRSPNLWPTSPAGFRVALEAYYIEMAALAAHLLGQMARALGLPAAYFVPMIDHHVSALRCLDYPALADPPRPGQQRAGAHTDYGTLTILRMSPGSSGLQVMSAGTGSMAGDWTSIDAVPRGFVVNIGDSLAQWTNDRWRSTMHRVVEPGPWPCERRSSIAFFHNANWDARIECLPGLGPPRHEPVLAGRHLMEKYQRSVT